MNPKNTIIQNLLTLLTVGAPLFLFGVAIVIAIKFFRSENNSATNPTTPTPPASLSLATSAEERNAIITAQAIETTPKTNSARSVALTGAWTMLGSIILIGLTLFGSRNPTGDEGLAAGVILLFFLFPLFIIGFLCALIGLTVDGINKRKQHSDTTIKK